MRSKVFLLTPLAWACVAALAQTLPTGGTITQGSGSIGVNGSSMLVQQNTARMVADWQSFSIGAGNSVRFVQPSSSSVALNRVLGSDPSQILGSLSANGHVYLQNAAGVYFAPGAQVDVGSLVATSLNADVGQFMAGRLRLSGGGDGAVRNEGSITSAPGGYVVLAGPQVSNTGSISAPLGTAALAAGSAVEIDPTGSGLLSIRVPMAAVNAKLENRGSISADGGLVSLQAVATDAALNTVMQVSGVVRARSIEQRDGQIVLSGGSSGVVRVDGTLDASGGAGLKGGTVKVLGDRVALLGNTTVDASGDTGGGTVLIGGNRQGQGPEANAQVTVVGAQASIDASARSSGDGGNVVVWADGATSYQGRIAARGGAAGGNGGDAEVSGKRHLDFTGEVDLTAAKGQKGTLLLDPDTLIVGTQADLNADGAFGDDLVTSPLLAGQFVGSNFPSQITAARVATLLAGGDVTLQSNFQLSVTAPLTVAANGANSTLDLQSQTVTIGAPMTLNNSSLTVTTVGGSDSISINAPISSLNSIALISQSTFINSSVTAGQVLLSTPNNRSGNATESATGTIITPSLTTLRDGDAGMTVTLTTAGNRVGTLTLDANDANIRIDNPAATPVTVQGNVSGNLTLDASGGMVQAGGALSVGVPGFGGTVNLTSRGSDAVALTNAANDLPGTVFFNTGGSLSLAAAGQLAATGTSVGNVAMQAGTQFVLPNGGITTTGATSTIDIRAVGFSNQTDGGPQLDVQPGGRFFIRTSDFTQDSLGFGFGTGLGNVNSVVLAGWTGADPATGNVYFTNATGTIATPGGDIAPVSKVYDGTTAFTYTQTGTTATGTTASGVFGPTVPLLGYTLTTSGDFLNKNAGTDKGYSVVSTNNVVGTGSGGEQYYGFAFAGFTRPAGTGGVLSAVTQRPLTTTGLTGVNRVYDGTTAVGLNTAGALLNNTVAGDNVTLVIGGATGAIANKNAGTARPVTVTGVALAGTDATNYSVSDASNATVDIAQRPINAIGLAAIDRIYDGTTTVALNASATTLTGVLPGDIVTATGGTGTMANKNVGTAKPVTLSTVTLGGTDGGNYLASGVGTGTVNIAVRPVTSTGVTGVDRVYDGTTLVALAASGATLSNAISGDAVGVSTGSATGTMADKNVGTGKPITITGVTLSGADAANYSLTDASVGSVTINPLSLRPVGIRAENKVVDGTTDVTLDTQGAKVNGVLLGDAVVLDTSGATGTAASSSPGLVIPVTVNGLQLTGADAGNYNLLAPVGVNGTGLSVRILTVPQQAFEDVRFQQYLQGVSDAQEPFRRAMADALAAGFGKENIRKQLSRGLVFETGLAAPAVDNIDTAARPAGCTAAGGASLGCGR